MHISRLMLFHFTCFYSLLLRNWKMPIIKVIEIFLVFCDQSKMMSDLNMSHENVWFCFISIAWIHFSHKAEKFWFWKSLKYINTFWWKRYDITFKYFPWENVWFSFIPWFGCTLVKKLRNFDCKSHWNRLIFFLDFFFFSCSNLF